MPSGAKKRKAAKKKQKQETTNSNNNSNASTNNNNNNDRSSSGSPLGNDDPRSQDERESDGGEVGSPASQDHQNHQHPFKETTEESERRDPSPVRSFDSENKSMEEVAQHIEGSKEVGMAHDGVTKTERGLKSEEDSGSQSISIKHIEFVEETHDGSSSSSSSSDDESQVTEKKLEEGAKDSITGVTPHNGESKPVDPLPVEIIEGTEKASFGEADNTVVDTALVGDSVKPLITVTEEVIHVPESDSAENSLVPDVAETRLEETEELKKTDEKVFPIVEDSVGATSTVVKSVANGNESKASSTSNSSIAETNNGAGNVRDSKIPDSSENQPLVTSAPQVAQRTSWMSCCGLLDVLTGSGR